MEEFTSYENHQFKWFWSKNSDWIADINNGGTGMMTLQLMQCDGRRNEAPMMARLFVKT